MADTLNKPTLERVNARLIDGPGSDAYLDTTWQFNTIADGTKVQVVITVPVADPTIGLDQDAWDDIYADAITAVVAGYSPGGGVVGANPVAI